jgi:hypothetical protein
VPSSLKDKQTGQTFCGEAEAGVSASEIFTPPESEKKRPGRKRKLPRLSPKRDPSPDGKMKAKKQLPLYTSTPTPRRSKRSKLKDEGMF